MSPQSNQSISLLHHELQAILSASSVQFANIAAGTSAGQSLEFEYSSDAATVSRFAMSRDITGASSRQAAGQKSTRHYLIASITKPVVGMCAVQLAANGRLSLNQPVREFIDGFNRGPLRSITIRHLLTHTGGLPDMLTNNSDLRARHASLSEFAAETARVTPEFLAGTACRYSSMGFSILAEIIEKIVATPLREVLRRDLFDPLQMRNSRLGLSSTEFDTMSDTLVPCELPIWQQQAVEWNWNSRYWRCLGAPWGGMISTAEDLGRLATCLLNSGLSPAKQQLIHPKVIEIATQNQTRTMAGLPEADRLHRPWGLGWRLNWPDHSTCFSDFATPETYGHWGATGTLMWIEPSSATWCVILTNQPYEISQPVIQRLSNRIATDLPPGSTVGQSN